VRVHARLRHGRIFTRGTGLWLRRALQMHAAAAVCLAPLVILPASRHPFVDGRILGFFGLHPAAWAVATDLLWLPTGLARNAAIGYLAQFAIAVIVVRDAWRRLAGRAPRSGLFALLGLVPLALGGLALFATLSGSVVVAFAVLAGNPSPLSLLLVLGVTVAQSFLGATFWLALPAAAVDGHRLLPALRRSRLLAHGSRFALFWLISVLETLEWILLIPIALALRESPIGEWAFAIPPFVFVTLKGCILAAAYEEACLRKEGQRPDEIVEVFS